MMRAGNQGKRRVGARSCAGGGRRRAGRELRLGRCNLQGGIARDEAVRMNDGAHPATLLGVAKRNGGLAGDEDRAADLHVLGLLGDRLIVLVDGVGGQGDDERGVRVVEAAPEDAPVLLPDVNVLLAVGLVPADDARVGRAAARGRRPVPGGGRGAGGRRGRRTRGGDRALAHACAAFVNVDGGVQLQQGVSQARRGQRKRMARTKTSLALALVVGCMAGMLG